MAHRFDARSRFLPGATKKVGSMHKEINDWPQLIRSARVSLRPPLFASLLLALQAAFIPTTRAETSHSPVIQTSTTQANTLTPGAQQVTTLEKGDSAAREIS